MDTTPKYTERGPAPMPLFFTWLLAPLMAVFSLVGMNLGCRQAIYEIVKPASNSETDPQRQDFKGEGNQGNPNGPGPTARVEVLWNGKSVTQVKVNEPTIIRPSADTLDPDDIGKSDCSNPGIVKAAYQVAQEASPVVDRGVRCEPLSTPYTFKAEGVYIISMTVTSNEGETAVASMTLRVVNDQNQNDFGGFTITANPLLAKVNQNIQFEGICTTPTAKVIRWKFADGAEGEGVTTTHAYGKSGSYLIEAKCQETAGANRTWDASLTVVVMDEVPNGAPVPTEKPEPPGPPVTPLPPPPGNPPVIGTGGGKNGGGGTTGGQKKCIFIFHCKSHW